ncbi:MULTISPECIES: ABC transporter permease [Streptosporangium]|uniref:ABC-type transport system involved in multi-copper enzyme maturation permease subunit n=1 Tax=Streptosporangium brasiliense TaxID=47480 RepID=A0ABT9REN6_9ACTN|nr:ABC transporter permease [Streptosporangium brasiliense]MDP9867738.1 ABC-type transport system involved in multi-copper enzyme maturation permease subunit [Streptosporangium brasiliense]
MTDVLAAEWLKLRSVRSTWYVLGLVALAVPVAAFLALQGVNGWDGLPPERRTRFQAPPVEQVLLPLVQLCMGVLAVLSITSEYATGTIRASLAAVPRRRRVLAGKAVVVAGISLLGGLLFLAGAFAAGRAVVGDRPLSPGYVTPPEAEIPMLLASGLSVAVVALVGLGLGAVLRSAAGAIVTVSALLFVLPVVAALLPAPWGGRAGSVLLPDLAGQLVDHPSAVGDLPPLGALAVLAAYVVAALGAGAAVLTRRDA